MDNNIASDCHFILDLQNHFVPLIFCFYFFIIMKVINKCSGCFGFQRIYLNVF